MGNVTNKMSAWPRSVQTKSVQTKSVQTKSVATKSVQTKKEVTKNGATKNEGIKNALARAASDGRGPQRSLKPNSGSHVSVDRKKALPRGHGSVVTRKEVVKNGPRKSEEQRHVRFMSAGSRRAVPNGVSPKKEVPRRGRRP